MTETQLASRIPLEDYAGLLDAGEIEELRALAKPLRGRSIEMINSTAVGGGVAEILNRLVPLAEELDLNIRWDVMTGDDDFFQVTKAFHNALHGGTYNLRPGDFDIFLQCNEKNRARLPLDAEFMVIHDPQPAALIDGRQAGSGHWVWRCHIDLSHPSREVWDFLASFVARYDGAMFSSPEFSRQLAIPQYLFYPAIDPLSEKNCELDREFITQVLARYQIDQRRPILTQISADDPEGAIVLKEVLHEADGDPDIRVLELPTWAPLEVNALQRASTVVIQKSLREGFGLTVSEALWKKKPVVASAVGGIPVQVIHKHTGLLAHSVEGAAYQIRYLLSHPEIAAKLGEHGHQHVKENFLITQKLKRYLTLFLSIAHAA